ncbi:hypothetical protein Acel_1625 [Acidothermus cellulolyticus 11B]|uniref:Uncharacterized protein n=1 Tax=Acidothermus cellulolyticus (strain ATCC 43068 / DSM 8971 / 11B) TaxID=351607 RepID=A0LVD7_ACIC1|nr:hypothetical protein [Acidothermus cellulolyticus]ABK53397.1 hypothetical protein Acel_1625 [Acidothermus cellulolyticus 11B]MCL6549402.1 hypothetical protein [Acidothermus cellulolyticus]
MREHLQVRAPLGDLSADVVKPGQHAMLNIAGFDHPVEGAVRGVDTEPVTGAAEGTDQSGPGSSDAEVIIDPVEQLPVALVGQSVAVTVVLSHTANPVLAVPLTAVITAPDGTTAVDIADSSGHIQRVHVDVGETGDGYAEIRHADPPLREGLRVVLTLDDSGSASAPATDASPSDQAQP